MHVELQELEELNMQTKARKFFKKLNKSRKDFKPRINQCRNRDGEILCEEQQILKRWTKYFEELLNIREETETTERKIYCQRQRKYKMQSKN